MIRSHRSPSALALLLGVLLLSACVPGNNGGAWGVGGSQGDASTEGLHAEGGLVIAVVPDIVPALQALVPAWQAAHPNVPVAFTSAPAVTNGINQNTFIGVDLLITDLQDVQKDAVTQGLIENPGARFAASTLDFITPAGNPGHVTRLQDTARPGLHLVNIAWPAGVAQLTQTALERMMRDPAFTPPAIPCPSNYATCTYGNIVVTVSDGLEAARLVAPPQKSTIPLPAHQLPLDGAFVYHTDYLQVERERGPGNLIPLPVPATFAPPQAFWCAVSSYQGANKSNARLFQSFLFSPAAQAIFQADGFLPAPDTAPAATP